MLVKKHSILVTFGKTKTHIHIVNTGYYEYQKLNLYSGFLLNTQKKALTCQNIQMLDAKNKVLRILADVIS